MPSPERLAYTPEARTQAAKFLVPPDIHADDFIYQHHLELQSEPGSDAARAHVTEYYFLDGDRSARRLHDLIRQHHPRATRQRLALFEFASGYGCVTRHLARMSDDYDLLTCDIHEQAISFLRKPIGVAATLSCSDPAAFSTDAKFDVVFALSFFSHMPDRTFGAWIEALFATLAKDGLLIFTTHGRNAHEELNRPDLMPGGYWFAEMSEQKDIPTDEYGCMIVTPSYVMRKIARLPGAALIGYQDGFWWGKQDVFIIRKLETNFRLQTDESQATEAEQEVRKLRESVVRLKQQVDSHDKTAQASRAAMMVIRDSTSWRLTRPLRAVADLLRGR